MITKMTAICLGLALVVSPKWKQPDDKALEILTVNEHRVNRDHSVSRIGTTRRQVILWATEKYDNRKQAEAFIEIVWRESRFNYRATNPTSGAYGLAQANPAEKYELIGSDWRNNIYTQLRWMHRYIEERYGSPMKALEHHDRKGWY